MNSILEIISNGVSLASKHPLAFIPFGVEAKTCIG